MSVVPDDAGVPFLIVVPYSTEVISQTDRVARVIPIRAATSTSGDYSYTFLSATVAATGRAT